MRLSACALSMTVLTNAPGLVAQPQEDGFVGIYADVAGTQAAAYVPPAKAIPLFVIAKVSGASATGITGAEFRIEVTNPEGWSIAYTPPYGTPVLVGHPIDADPDSDADRGMRITFPNCQPPVDGIIHLGSLAVYNAGGSRTNLLVKRRLTPSAPDSACPLFALCDPAHTAVCMRSSTEPPHHTLPAERPRVASTELVTFDLTVNPTAEPELPGIPFTRSIDLGNSELWVMGREVEGRQVVCSFDGTVLTIGGIPVPVSSSQVPERNFTDQELTRAYGAVPAVRARLANDCPMARAVALFDAEHTALFTLASAARRSVGTSGAREILLASSMVERVEITGETLRYWLKGIAWSWGLPGPSDLAGAPLDATGTARRRAAEIEQAVRGTPFQGCLIVITHDGQAAMSGSDRAAAHAQIAHLQNGGSVDTAPRGPLAATMLRDIFEVRHENDRK